MNVSRLPQVRVDKYGFELERHGTRAFPCGVYECDPLVNEVPWHWHPELEFVYVKEGSLLYAAAGRRFELGEGDAAFVIGNVPHAEFPLQNRHALEADLVCDARFLYGTRSTTIYQRYFSKLGTHEAPRAIKFSARGQAWEREAAQAVARAHQAASQGASYFELTVRESLTKVVLLAVDQGSEQDARAWPTEADSERLKAMVSFIERHYTEPITVAEIARASHVSVREAQRTFRAYTGDSPIGYLLDLRLRIASRMLRQGNETVGAIARSCGFDSQSYFSRKFKSSYGCTPLQWRQTG